MIFLRSKNRQRALVINSIYSTRANVNERLTSMGGLFGFLSIVVTGALLYAIFTAKSEDKWYYITAVLINIILLILLMIGAIAFDRFYIKRWTTRRLNRQLSIHTNMPNSSASSTNPDQQESANYFCANDIPPTYPGYAANEASVPMPTFDSLPANTDSAQCCCQDPLNDIDKAKPNLPPNYHELYPFNNLKLPEQSSINQIPQ
jgi:hypothetical protein